MTKEERIQTYKQTVKESMRGYYQNKNNDYIFIPQCLSDDAVLYSYPPLLGDEGTTTILPEIEVVDNDTLSAARDLVQDGYRVTVLNMASSYIPGGGVMKGSGAQEEDLFRRSNLFTSLYNFHPIGHDFGYDVQPRNLFYPIDGDYDLIWTPGVKVFKDSEKNNFEYLDEAFTVNVITCAAVRKPELVDGKLKKEDEVTMRHKIQTILRCASVVTGVGNAVVLGAFGCGAYGNPPEQIANIFREEILRCGDIGKLDKIVFAIIDSNSVYENHNPKGNLKPFQEILNDIK